MTFPPPSSGPSAQDPYGQDPYGAGAPSPSAPGAQAHDQHWPHGGDPSSGPAANGGAPTEPAPGTDLGADVGAALRFAGNSLLRNPLTFLGAGLLYSVLLVVVTVLAFVVMMMVTIAMVESSPSAGGDPSFGQMIVILALSFVIVVIAGLAGALWQAGSARAAGVVLEGGRPAFGQALIGPGRVLATTLLVLLIVMVGTFLLYLPGLIAGVVLMYAIPASVSGASPLAAVKESFALARANIGTTIVGYLAFMAASYVGGMVVIGMIVVIPFGVLLQMGLYERLSGRHLPEPARA
jgi:hypothetical protein